MARRLKQRKTNPKNRREILTGEQNRRGSATTAAAAASTRVTATVALEEKQRARLYGGTIDIGINQINGEGKQISDDATATVRGGVARRVVAR